MFDPNITVRAPNALRPYAAPNNIVELPAHVRDGVRIPRLFASGDVSLVQRMGIAVVGSRSCTVRGRELASSVVRVLARAELVVISGLAQGVDVAAHRSAMLAGGRTIAVIGTPLERAYPKEHAPIQEAIAREHLVLSPFANGTRTAAGHFPARNRVMARLARATIVIEAGERSGTVHQVRESLSAGRRVLIHDEIIRSPHVFWARELLGTPNVHTFCDSVEVLEHV